MDCLILDLVNATKEADGYCPGFRKQHMIKYLESLHHTSFDSLLNQLEGVTKEQAKTQAIRSNIVVPV